MSHITRNPEVGRRGRGSRSMMALGGWLFLSFCSTLFNVWMSFLMHVTSKLPSGFCIPGLKPHLSTFLPEQGGRNRRQWYLHQESRSFPRTPPPPSGCCLQYTYPGPRARIIQFHPLLNLPHQASCASISWWIPLPSSLMSIPSLPFSTNSASAQAVFRPCRSWCKSLSSTQPTDWEF